MASDTSPFQTDDTYEIIRAPQFYDFAKNEETEGDTWFGCNKSEEENDNIITVEEIKFEPKKLLLDTEFDTQTPPKPITNRHSRLLYQTDAASAAQKGKDKSDRIMTLKRNQMVNNLKKTKQLQATKVPRKVVRPSTALTQSNKTSAQKPILSDKQINIQPTSAIARKKKSDLATKIVRKSTLVTNVNTETAKKDLEAPSVPKQTLSENKENKPSARMSSIPAPKKDTKPSVTERNRTRQSVMPTTVKKPEQDENAYIFRALPLNRKILNSCGDIGVPRLKKMPLTQPMSPKLHTSARSRQPRVNRNRDL